MNKVGKTYLIGAGPGDAGLLTIKGREILEKGDVVIYDALINKEILEYCKPGAELIYVGKKIGQKELNQKEINNLLKEKSLQGKQVVRLKGGDPFIFGRGGEETEFLSKNGVDFEVVPGVSSITAVPAYCGVPLTHRDYNSSFAVYTGHFEKFNPNDRNRLKSLKEIETLVFLMGLNNIENIIRNLIESGRDLNTPVLITSHGTLPNQKSLRGTIFNILDKLKKNKDIETPAIILVGEIVKLEEHINWYEKKPLFGKTVIITRDKNYNKKFSKLLYDQGATVIEFPTIKISHLKSYKSLDKSINNLDKYDYVIFTSVNGVRYFFERLETLSKDSREFKNKKIITIGVKTSDELKKYNLKSDYTPFEYVAEGIINLINDLDIKDKNILIPRAKVARDVLPKELKKLGAKVDVKPAYETKIPRYTKKDIEQLKVKLADDSNKLITFTSSSTVTNFFKLISKDSYLFNNVKFASIGPITAKTLEEQGYKSDIIAKKYTIDGLTEEILAYYS